MSENKKIAKNTLFLYLRMIFTIAISLYTSRLVLKVLGVEDFGIYSVVGGILSLFTFLHGTLSGSTIRFLNISMIEGVDQLKKVFSTSVILHYLFALIVFIIAETIGLWLFYNKIVIPENRIEIAFWVYQMSVISSIFSIIQIPYDAAIIAHEKMNVYAYLSIIETFFKLVAVFLIGYLNLDNLLMYSIFMMIVSLVTRLLYQLYCLKKFPECKYSIRVDKVILKKMAHFFSWDLYGNMCFALNSYGTNIIQNMFFGPLINTSIAIISKAQEGIAMLGNNITFAIKPQIIQSYSKKDLDRLYELLVKGTKYSFLIISIIAIPFFVYSKLILQLWLGEIPIYSDVLFQIAIISLMVNISFSLLIPIIHATGHIKLISFIGGSVYLSSLFLSYLFLKNGFNPTITYYINCGISFFAGIVNLFLVKKYLVHFNFKKFLLKSIILRYFFFSLNLVLMLLLSKYLFFNLFSLILLGFVSLVITIILNLDNFERKQMFNFIKNKVK